jgi:hypothetical protein
MPAWPVKLAAAVEQRLRPPMSPEDWLAEGWTQRDEMLQIAETGGVLWHDADRQSDATTRSAVGPVSAQREANEMN